MDAHFWFEDSDIAQDIVEPGVPIFAIFEWHVNHFGASLIPLPDSSLLVYKALENHPIGLERGDKVIGYDGLPYHALLKKMLSFELPFAWNGTSATEYNRWYAAMTAAGENWHLFDSIDIVKYGTTDTLSFSTDHLMNVSSYSIGTEQLPVPGVRFPDYDNYE
jgi:hypothetical protein